MHSSRCKLLYIEWINNKVLPYSTGIYIQYPVINHNGKDYNKEYILHLLILHPQSFPPSLSLLLCNHKAVLYVQKYRF